MRAARGCAIGAAGNLMCSVAVSPGLVEYGLSGLSYCDCSHTLPTARYIYLRRCIHFS